MKKPFRKAILEAVAITFAATVIALIFNALRPNGLPVFQASDTRTKSTYPKISLDEVLQKMDQPRVWLLDARPEEDFQSGHIPKSRNLPYDRFDDWVEYVLSEMDPKDELIAYCSSPDCHQAADLADQLSELGYETIYLFSGGMEAWRRNDHAVETGPSVR